MPIYILEANWQIALNMYSVRWVMVEKAD